MYHVFEKYLLNRRYLKIYPTIGHNENFMSVYEFFDTFFNRKNGHNFLNFSLRRKRLHKLCLWEAVFSE